MLFLGIALFLSHDIFSILSLIISHMIKQSFPCMGSNTPTILILGSLPGDKSLAINQYYGHPRNRFWKLLFDIFQKEFSLDYAVRQELLIHHQVMLWDVASSAVRKGSLDVDIMDEVPNPIDELLERHPTIQKIIFNGKKAEQMYKRFFVPNDKITYYANPSTSPANASFKYEQLYALWAASIQD